VYRCYVAPVRRGHTHAPPLAGAPAAGVPATGTSPPRTRRRPLWYSAAFPLVASAYPLWH
jgi:hypothetical protein